MKKITYFVLLVVILFGSCKKDDHVTNVSTKRAGLLPDGDEIKLGKKLQNPYTVKVMKEAYANLLKSGGINRTMNTNVNIRTTHLYVRFLPKDWKQYDLLKSDTSLKLFDFPLDYEVSEGSFYHDPEIPAGLPTWQYTSVPVDYDFNPDIKYEILEKLYLPELDAALHAVNGRMAGSTANIIKALTNEAMHLTNNDLDIIESDEGSQISRSKWTPSGRITVYDTRLGHLIPLVGVKVRARRWFTINEVLTDANGYFTNTHRFRRRVNYAVFYERGDFDVRSGTFGQAYYNGPKKRGAWNLDINNGVNRFYAHVFRGAERYFYGDIGGLRRPVLTHKVKYGVYDKDSKGQSGINWGNWTPGIIPAIKIWRWNGSVEYSSDEVFSTTVHETAHTSHISLMNAGEIQFIQVSPTIRESWAVAVEWYITSMEYRERGISNYASPAYSVSNLSYPLNQAYQYWTKGVSDRYTPVFIDLIDDYNQSLYFTGSDIPNDNVNGYTLPAIESGFLKHVYGISSLSEQLKAHKPLGVTDTKINTLLSFY